MNPIAKVLSEYTDTILSEDLPLPLFIELTAPIGNEVNNCLRG